MQRTPLFETHRGLGARLVDFAGWEMPLNYGQGIQAEHLAVRTDAGLFDVSHMGELRVRGPEAGAFLAFATLNDPTKLAPGRGQYSMLPNDRGGLIDDLYVYCDGAGDEQGDYLVVCNASNRKQVLQHLQTLVQDHPYDATVADESDSWALLALQGPGSALLLSRVAEGDVGALKKNRKRAFRLGGASCDAARTGYTGEDGFELFCRPEDAERVWSLLTERGAQPCGLGARDTLRLEAGFPLYGHEFDERTNPLCSPYAWVVKDKPFYGREAMWNAPCRERLVGLRLEERGVARQGYRVLRNGDEVGTVTSGTISPLTRDGIALAWLRSDLAEPGTPVDIEIRGQPLAARVTPTPFYAP